MAVKYCRATLCWAQNLDMYLFYLYFPRVMDGVTINVTNGVMDRVTINASHKSLNILKIADTYNFELTNLCTSTTHNP